MRLGGQRLAQHRYSYFPKTELSLMKKLVPVLLSLALAGLIAGQAG